MLLDEPPARVRRYRGWTLTVVSIATFMLMLDLTVVYVAMPDMQATYGSSFSALQWVLDAYAIGLALSVALFVTAFVSGALAIAVVDPARAGMASGINVTFQQVGAAIGIAALGAVFQNWVSHHFTASPVGPAFEPRAGASVAADGGAGLFSAIRRQPGLARRVLHEAREAYLAAFDQVLVAAAGVALTGAVVAALLIRTRDLHESATQEGAAR